MQDIGMHFLGLDYWWRELDDLMREKMQTSAIPKLSNSTLSKLPSGVKIPNYNRSNLTAGIVHIGLGNFHRAH